MLHLQLESKLTPLIVRLFGDKPEGLLMIDTELGTAATKMAASGATGPTVGN